MQENGNTSYTSYQKMMSQVSSSLKELEQICKKMNLEESRKELERSREKLANHKFAVGVMGEFKRGKSTVINSMLGKEVMPADILPCSATMNRVTYDMQPHAKLYMRDGSVREIPVEQLSDYVTKLTGENESRAAEVEEAVVYYPCHFCQNGVDIVDTPGLNDDERMNRISEEVIPYLDAVIMVLTPDNPFSMSEAEFVRSKLMTSDLGRMIFLVNKIDTIRRASDRERVVQGIREKIQASVLEKTASVYGENSTEYQNTKMKLGDIRIFPISALDALDGKLEGDQQLIEQSGTIPFEDALTHMLTEERGALELATPLNVIQNISLQVARAALTKKEGMKLSNEEFNVRQQEALQQIQEMRERKKEEKKRLNDNAGRMRRQMEQEVLKFYPELENRLISVVDAFSVDVKTLKDTPGQDAAAEQMRKAVSSEMQSSMSLLSEKIQVQMQDMIGQEAIRMGAFMSDISGQIDRLQVSIGKEGSSVNTSQLVAYGVDTILGGFGIGGIVAGYQNAGVKGAIVGGGISYAATYSMAAMLVSMSIPILPLALISVAAGTLAGKYFTSKMFSKDVGNKRLEELRRGMRANIHQMLQDMKNKRELENWSNELVEGRYAELIAGMEAECERILKDTENTIDSIKKDLTESKILQEHVEKECEEIETAVKRMNEELRPLVCKVQDVLKNA